MAPDLPSPAVLDHLRHAGGLWYPGLGPAPADVTVVAHLVRPRSAVTIVLLGGSVQVVVKVARSGPPLEERPRLGIGPDDLARRDQLEWDGLGRAWQACGSGARPGLAAVRPLAYLADERAVVMGYIEGDTVRDVLRAASRASWPWPASPHDVAVVVRRMGAWLAAFHAQGAEAGERRATDAELAATATSFAEHLAPRQPDAAALVRRLAAEPPRGPLPLGLGHGDFAPRNGIVTHDGAVVVLDVLGRWRLPVHEDLALLLLELRTGGPQLVTAGHAFPARILRSVEDALLDGYGEAAGEPVDRRTLAWFSGLVLADRWAAHLARTPSGVLERARHAVVGRALHRETVRASSALDVGAAW